MYRQAAAENKNVDVAGLMIQALEKNTITNTIPVSQKRWAYLIALGAPPFGLFFAAKFYFSNYEDRKDAAMICIVLTTFAFLLFSLILKSMLSGSGASLEQIQQIKPADIQELIQ